jgi:predicted RNase H-like HicB family nuclease
MNSVIQEIKKIKISDLDCVLEWDSCAKSFAVYGDDEPGCTSCGDTEEEAIQNMKEAIKLYFQCE